MDRLKSWRLIADEGVSDSFGLAADECLAGRVGTGESPATLRLYTYASHCALAGRFQNIENEIHVDFCRANGIPINRRPTGGGAIIMGADQLGVALVVPGRGQDGIPLADSGSAYSRAREWMARFSAGLVCGLQELGIQAHFRRKNDIEVDGRKLVGLGIYRAPSGGLLFHASLLVGLDVALMLKILNTPFEKITPREVSTVASRTTTVRRETGLDVPTAGVREVIARGFSEAFHVDLVPGDFTVDERRAAHRLEAEKYRTEDWVFQNSEVPDAVGTARIKTGLGLLDVRVALAGRMMKAAYIGGDFFASESAVADLEGRLRWHSSAPVEIESTVQEIFSRRSDELNGDLAGPLVEALHRAVSRAMTAEKVLRADPYGCFVTPGGSHV